MTYIIAKREQDEHGVWRALPGRECDLEEFGTLDLKAFDSAMDLPDDVEFADGFDADGVPIRVYRS